ncbi:MAG TPA: 30S ribosomal protein S16 [Acidimicrobiia bacterium]|nr:30S ribosomal protein S16 [Acidimicrobiia bacterium]
MVKIRLMRVGKRKQPSYRVVVADSRSPRDGRIIEAIGHYHPRQEPSVVSIDSDRAVYWLERGAQPSNTVQNLLRISGAWSALTGEAPPPGVAQPPTAEAPKKATPAASIKATPAASVTDDALPEAETEEALLADRPEGDAAGDAGPGAPAE